MPPEELRDAQGNALLEELFHSEYQKLVRYAAVILKRYGARHVCISGRAEDVVQELFCLAWEKQEDVLRSESPVGWLYKALTLKAREALREDRLWVKRLTLIPGAPEPGEPPEPPEEWSRLLPPEDYELLRKLYLEGYSYKELCAQLGVKKSALAMRVRRIKERFQKNYENF